MKVLDKVTGQFIYVPDFLNLDELKVSINFDMNACKRINPLYEMAQKNLGKFTIRNLGEAFDRFTIAESTFSSDEVRIIVESLYEFSEIRHDSQINRLIEKLRTEEIKVDRFDRAYINDIENLKEHLKSQSDLLHILESKNNKYKELFKGNVFKVIYKCVKHWLCD